MTAKTVDQVGDAALADEPLRAVDDPYAVAVATGPGPGRRDVAAGLGLGQGEGDQLPARRPGRGTSARFCSSRAGQEERQRGQLLDGEDQPARRADPADLLDGEADGQQVATEPAVRDSGYGRARMSWLGEQLLDVPRELGRPVDLGRARRDPLVGEDPDGVAEGCLILGEAIRRNRLRLGGRRRAGHAARS